MDEGSVGDGEVEASLFGVLEVEPDVEGVSGLEIVLVESERCAAHKVIGGEFVPVVYLEEEGGAKAGDAEHEAFVPCGVEVLLDDLALEVLSAEGELDVGV